MEKFIKEEIKRLRSAYAIIKSRQSYDDSFCLEIAIILKELKDLKIYKQLALFVNDQIDNCHELSKRSFDIEEIIFFGFSVEQWIFFAQIEKVEDASNKISHLLEDVFDSNVASIIFKVHLHSKAILESLCTQAQTLQIKYYKINMTDSKNFFPKILIEPNDNVKWTYVLKSRETNIRAGNIQNSINRLFSIERFCKIQLNKIFERNNYSFLLKEIAQRVIQQNMQNNYQLFDYACFWIPMHINDIENVSDLRLFLCDNSDELVNSLYLPLLYAKAAISKKIELQVEIDKHISNDVRDTFLELIDYADLQNGYGKYLSLIPDEDDFWNLEIEYTIIRGKELYNALHPENPVTLPINLDKIKNLLYADSVLAISEIPKPLYKYDYSLSNRADIIIKFSLEFENIASEDINDFRKVLLQTEYTNRKIVFKPGYKVERQGKLGKKNGATGAAVLYILLRYLYEPNFMFEKIQRTNTKLYRYDDILEYILIGKNNVTPVSKTFAQLGNTLSPIDPSNPLVKNVCEKLKELEGLYDFDYLKEKGEGVTELENESSITL